MSKTFTKLFDKKEAKKRKSDALRRLEKRTKDNERLFKREVQFTTYLERTAPND